MSDLEKIRIPAIKVIKISDNRVIHIGDQIFGKLVIKLLNEDGDFVEGCDIQIPGYCGEEFFITVPEAWIGKQVLIRYERDIKGYKISNLSSLYPKIMQIHGEKDERECWVNIPLNIPEESSSLKVDYAPKDVDLSYTITFNEDGSYTTEDQRDDWYKLLIEWLEGNGVWNCDEIIYYDEDWNKVGISYIDNPNIIRWIKN